MTIMNVHTDKAGPAAVDSLAGNYITIDLQLISNMHMKVKETFLPAMQRSYTQGYLLLSWASATSHCNYSCHVNISIVKKLCSSSTFSF